MQKRRIGGQENNYKTAFYPILAGLTLNNISIKNRKIFFYLILISEQGEQPVSPQCAAFGEEGAPLSGGKVSRSISRVLSWTIIHLRRTSPFACSDLPESAEGHGIRFLFGLAPGGVYHRHDCCQPRGALLPHLFTLTCKAGGFLSVALSVGSRPPGVTWRPDPLEPGLSSALVEQRSSDQLTG